MNDRHEPLRLLPKRKKGILRLLFSRLIIFAALILIQILIFLVIYVRMNEILPYFRIFQYVFSLFMVFYLFNCGMDSSAKLTWLAVIMAAPIPGTALLWYTKVNIGHKALTRRVSKLISDTKSAIPQDEAVIKAPEIISSGTDDLSRYLCRTGCFPLYSGTKSRYFPSGEEMFEAMIEELEKAEKFIFLEFFILDEGKMWGTILSILREKAAQGVDVRVMYDGMCEISSLSFDYPERLAKLGIKCKDFAPIRPVVSTHYNYRDHRKILVVDNNTAFTGGVNLADEYINLKPRFGHWKDSGIMLTGDAVRSFTLMFLQMWNITERVPEWSFVGIPNRTTSGDGYVMPFGDIPLDNEKVGENIYMDILNRSTTFVHIMTPYLILDGELENSMRFAAQRGIDVRLILPGIPDKKSAYAVAKRHYRSLLSAGVRIYEYTPGFVHSKVFVADGLKAVVGSINLDYRSLYHHFECAAYLYGASCIFDIERDFQATLAQCREVTRETVKHEKLGYRLLGGILRMIAPLM